MIIEEVNKMANKRMNIRMRTMLRPAPVYSLQSMALQSIYDDANGYADCEYCGIIA
jgi:hypothetical protein